VRGELLVQLAATDDVPAEERDSALVEAAHINAQVRSQRLGARIRFADALQSYRHSMHSGRYDASVSADLEAAYHVLGAAGEVEDAFRALAAAGIYEVCWGLLRRAEQRLQAAFDYQRRVRIQVDEVCPEVTLASLAWLHGDFARFERLAGRLSPAVLDASIFPMQYAEYRGDLDGAVALMPDPAIAGNVPAFLTYVLGARARVWKNAGDHGQARCELDTWAGLIADLPWPERGVRLAGLADVIVAVADEDFVRQAYELATASPLRWDRSLGPSADRARGDLALRLGLLERADDHYRDGLAWCEHEHVPVEAAWCRLGQANIARILGDEEAVASHAQKAHELFRVYGAALGRAQVESLRQPEGGAAGRSDLAGGLTEREVEVLRLLAMGQTNGQIAGALVISPNTVANHVRRIREKTGSANRTQAAAFAIRVGLGV
jgi:DNA-binding CsgD family transcriptional regulator